MPSEVPPSDISALTLLGWAAGAECDSRSIATSRSKASRSTRCETIRRKTRIIRSSNRGASGLADTRRRSRTSVTCRPGRLHLRGRFPRGRPRGCFITMAKEGSTIGRHHGRFGRDKYRELSNGVSAVRVWSTLSRTAFEPWVTRPPVHPPVPRPPISWSTTSSAGWASLPAPTRSQQAAIWGPSRMCPRGRTPSRTPPPPLRTAFDSQG